MAGREGSPIDPELRPVAYIGNIPVAVRYIEKYTCVVACDTFFGSTRRKVRTADNALAGSDADCKGAIVENRKASIRRLAADMAYLARICRTIARTLPIHGCILALTFENDAYNEPSDT